MQDNVRICGICVLGAIYVPLLVLQGVDGVLAVLVTNAIVAIVLEKKYGKSRKAEGQQEQGEDGEGEA